MFKIRSLIILMCLLFSTGLKAAPSLIADVITVTEDGNTINAHGNVEIEYKKIKLTAEKITYNKITDQIRAIGPITFYDGDNSLIIADNAIFDKNFRDAALNNAKFLLSDSLKIISKRIIRKNGATNEFHETRASTCNICSKSDTPLWEIRAKKIHHDEKSKQIYFYKSQFRFFGIPMAYFPIIRLPDPNVKRAKGFLTPDLSYSTASSTKLQLPYFIPLTDYSDVIVSPAINTNGSYSVGFDYRQLFEKSEFKIDAFGINSTTDQATNGYLFTRFNSQINPNKRFQFQYERASNTDLITSHTNKNKKSTESHIEISEKGRSYYFYSGLYEGILQNSEINQENFPNMNFKSNLSYQIIPDIIGGHAALSINADGYKRKSTTDGNLGRDALKANLSLLWQRNKITNLGNVFSIKSYTTTGLSKYYNDSENPSLNGYFRQIGGVELSRPMINNFKNSSLIYAPKIQIAYAPPLQTSEPNELSQHSEISYSNFFDLNHSYGSDRSVNGLNLKTGFEGSYHSSNDDQINFFIGNFSKLNGHNSFAIGSGLESASSSNIGALNITMANNLTFNADVATDSALSVTRNNLRLSFRESDMDLYSNYFYKIKNDIMEKRSELSFGSGFKVNRHTHTDLSLIYDTDTNKAISSKLQSRYKHDCMTMDFYVSRDFNTSSSSSPGIKLGIKLELIGLGAGKLNSENNNNQCIK